MVRITEKLSTKLERFKRCTDGKYLVCATGDLVDPYAYDPQKYRMPMEAISLKRIAREQGFPMLTRAIQWCLEYHYERQIVAVIVDGGSPDVLRKDGKTLEVKHPLRIALGLMAETSIMAFEAFSAEEREILLVVILLHDIIENTDVTWTMLCRAFGKPVANYVKTLSRKVHTKTKANAKQYIRGIMRNHITIIAKIADRRDTIHDSWVLSAKSLVFNIWESQYLLKRMNKALKQNKYPVAKEALALLSVYESDIKNRVLVAQNILSLKYENKKKDKIILKKDEVIKSLQDELEEAWKIDAKG